MHDIWNPWHGCVKCSEGCQNSYMDYNDARRGKNGADIYRTKAGFRYQMVRRDCHPPCAIMVTLKANAPSKPISAGSSGIFN